MYTSTLVFGLAAIVLTNALVTPGMSPAKRHDFNTEGDCSPEPAGSGPTISPDTDLAFVDSPVLASIATNAATPARWSVVYQDLQAASSDSGYLGVEELTSYNTAYCASQCCNFWTGCESFNIYFERDPVLDPGPNCTNPASTTRIKCSYWSVDITQADATNTGQYCEDFHVVIAGSNAYKGGCANSTSTSTSTSTSSSSTVVASTSSSVVATSSTAITTSSSLTTITKSSTKVISSSTTKATVSTWSSWPQSTPPAPTAAPAPPVFPVLPLPIAPAPPAPSKPAPAPALAPAPAKPNGGLLGWIGIRNY